MKKNIGIKLNITLIVLISTLLLSCDSAFKNEIEAQRGVKKEKPNEDHGKNEKPEIPKIIEIPNQIDLTPPPAPEISDKIFSEAIERIQKLQNESNKFELNLLGTTLEKNVKIEPKNLDYKMKSEIPEQGLNTHWEKTIQNHCSKILTIKKDSDDNADFKLEKPYLFHTTETLIDLTGYCPLKLNQEKWHSKLFKNDKKSEFIKTLNKIAILNSELNSDAALSKFIVSTEQNTYSQLEKSQSDTLNKNFKTDLINVLHRSVVFGEVTEITTQKELTIENKNANDKSLIEEKKYIFLLKVFKFSDSEIHYLSTTYIEKPKTCDKDDCVSKKENKLYINGRSIK